jgi:selenide,water dikinase
MAQGSDTEIALQLTGFSLLPKALELAQLGVLPAGLYRNRHFAERWVEPGDTPLCRQDLLYDPQTSGGLMMAVDPADGPALLAALKGRVPAAQLVGRVCPYRGGKRIFLQTSVF